MIDDFLDALELLLTTEATFVAALQALNLSSTGTPAIPQVLRGNRPLSQIPQELFPCWVIEHATFEPNELVQGGDFQTLGTHAQGMRARFPVTLVWHQQDHTDAFNQRAGLAWPTCQLFLRNPDPGGVVLAWFDRSESEMGAQHPLQVWRAEIVADLEIRK